MKRQLIAIEWIDASLTQAVDEMREVIKKEGEKIYETN